MDRAPEPSGRWSVWRRVCRESFPPRRAAFWYLALLLIAAFVLRVWFASGWPNSSRVWDERYSFENVGSVLATGSLEPVRNFYPSPVYYLPPALAIAAAKPFVDHPESRLFNPETGRFGPLAYHLGRGIQVLYGTASVLLIHLLGVMTLSRQVGLLAATTLAFLPWHIQVSGVFKPDAQVVFFILVVLIAGVRWMRSPSAARALAVATAVALATSSKLVAGVAGAAFGLGASLSGRGRRQYAQIALAGAGSVGLFLLLNPHLGVVLEGIEDIKRDYARRARWAGMTRAQIPLRTLDYLLEPLVLGPLVGAVALVGYVALWVSALRALRGRPVEVAGPRLMLVAFPLLYVGLHTLQSAWFRDNNFTHILPSFVLAAAAVLVALLHAGARLRHAPRAALAAAGVATLVVLVAPGPLFVYRSYTPSTLDVAYRLIGRERSRAQGRVVIVEPVEARGALWRRAVPLGEDGAAVVRVPEATLLPETRRRRSDAQILLGKIPRRSIPSYAVARRVVRPKLGERRGPAITLVTHPWTRRSERPARGARWVPGGDLLVELPRLDAGSIVSITLRVGSPPAVTPRGSPRLLHGGESVLLHRIDRRVDRFVLLSERFACCESEDPTARITGLARRGLTEPRAGVYLWIAPRDPE